MMAETAIDLYVGLFDDIDCPEIRDACAAILSPDEHARANRFLLERNRREYVLAHGLARTALSLRAPAVAPESWSFAVGRYGRPFVAAPKTNRPLYFNISHTEGCVACIVSEHERVGVDVEATTRVCSYLEIADFKFSPIEVAALRGAPNHEIRDRFFDIWTLKEAYIKARGMGLHLPLDQFAMIVTEVPEIGINFVPGFDDDAAHWRFMQTSPAPHIRLAVADGSGHPGGLRIVAQAWPVR